MTEPKEIAILYLKSRFWIDLLSTIPFDLFIPTDGGLFFIKLFGLLKVVRVTRLNRIINLMNVKDDLKMTLKLLKLVYFLLLYIHFAACIWWFIVKNDKNWIPQMDYMFLATDTYDNFSVTKQYLQCFYHSIILLGGSGIGHRNNTQIINSIIVLLIGAIINANIFGNMAVIVQDLNAKASRFQEKIDTANTSMNNLKLPAMMQDKVREYLFYTQSNLENQRELEDFKTMISPSLRLEVYRQIFMKVLIANPIFGDNPELNELVIEKVITYSYPPEDIIIRQGDAPNALYILSKGELAVMVKDEFNKESFVRVLQSGSIFGEVALITDCPRTATVKCLNYCTCASLPIEGFREVCKLFPETLTKLKTRRSEYRDRWKTFMLKIINTVYYFKNLSDNSIEEIFYSLETDYFEKDTVLVEAGDSLDKIWILVDGEVDINVQMDTGETVIIETLNRGCHFGQFSCLIEAPQMFQYRAKTNVMIQSINTVMLENLRMELADLDDELANGFIHEYGVPVCDFKVNHLMSKNQDAPDYALKKLKRRFQDCVRRAFVLNMYKKKKTPVRKKKNPVRKKKTPVRKKK